MLYCGVFSSQASRTAFVTEMMKTYRKKVSFRRGIETTSQKDLLTPKRLRIEPDLDSIARDDSGYQSNSVSSTVPLEEMEDAIVQPPRLLKLNRFGAPVDQEMADSMDDPETFECITNLIEKFKHSKTLMTATSDPDSIRYTVVAIKDHRWTPCHATGLKGCLPLFKVQWFGYLGEDTEEPLSHLVPAALVLLGKYLQYILDLEKAIRANEDILPRYPRMAGCLNSRKKTSKSSLTQELIFSGPCGRVTEDIFKKYAALGRYSDVLGVSRLVSIA